MRTFLTLSAIDLLWIMIGVILTVIGTLVSLSIPMDWIHRESGTPYTFSLQIGGVLFTACIGGPVVGLYAQVIYILLGLAGLQIFSFGGGLEYLQQPTFGYLLGFIPGSWVCGFLAFRSRPQSQIHSLRDHSSIPKTSLLASLLQQFRDLVIACLCGLAVIHLTGLTYLSVQTAFSEGLTQLVMQHSLLQLPGQLIVLIGVATMALISRRLLLY